MPDIAVKTSLTTAPVRDFNVSSTNVEASGKGVVRAGDLTKSPVSSVLPIKASQTVFANGKNVVRKNDVLIDESKVNQGISSVEVGG